MGVNKRDVSKVVRKNVNQSNLDVRIVHKHEGNGKERRVTNTSYGIYTTKNKVKDGFKTPEIAMDFLMENIKKYDKKIKKFR